mmetsp:Transcript_17779/g.62712  ORF Transcript_17779/g.62712 Transcript_17779/m.62712 type:complete len:246 (-) Transcript_17779:269-1006(-)
MPSTASGSSSASVNASTTVIWFWVSVPVLSTHTTVVHPSASTAGSFFTTALCLLMRSTPSASVTVTTTGRPSGMAATASETAIWNISSSSRPCTRPITTMTPMTANDMYDSCSPSLSMRVCSGVLVDCSSFTSSNTLPISVRSPVATTTPVARPWRTNVPRNPMLLRSAIGTRAPLSSSFSFSIALEPSCAAPSPFSSPSPSTLPLLPRPLRRPSGVAERRGVRLIFFLPPAPPAPPPAASRSTA